MAGFPHRRERLYFVCVRADIVQAVGLQATEDFIAGFCFILERLLVLHEI